MSFPRVKHRIPSSNVYSMTPILDIVVVWIDACVDHFFTLGVVGCM